ncbi:MAG: ABC transporter permease subunit [Dehalococcoidales bacterium]|nr:ABC transporter permease subunit [Dehalococcoidales bacterium]
MENNKTKKFLFGFSTRTRFILLGILALVVVWQLGSLFLPSIIVASPLDTVSTLLEMIITVELWTQLGISLSRIALGVLAGCAVGSSLGIIAGLNQKWQAFFEPLRWVVMTTPSIVILVLVLMLVGLGSGQAILMTSIITLPFSYVSTLEGMQAIDRRLIEMAEVFKIPRRLRLTNIYLPGIGAAIMAGLTLSAGIGVRASILAEFMGAQEGIGHKLFLSWTHLNTPELYAWILFTFALLAAIEFGVLRPLRNILLRWQVAR